MLHRASGLSWERFHEKSLDWQPNSPTDVEAILSNNLRYTLYPQRATVNQRAIHRLSGDALNDLILMVNDESREKFRRRNDQTMPESDKIHLTCGFGWVIVPIKPLRGEEEGRTHEKPMTLFRRRERAIGYIEMSFLLRFTVLIKSLEFSDAFQSLLI